MPRSVNSKLATATQCFGPVIEPHEAIPDGQGGALVTWDYFGNYTLCTGNQAAVKVARTSGTQVTGTYQLPLARGMLTSYFSDNDGDAVLGQDHLFVTDSRRSVAGLQLSTSTIDVNWQAAACTTSPCPEISLAGVAPGDKVIVNQTGNSDGSSTLFSLAPGTGTCAPSTFCVTSAPPVPNATLTAFDFSGSYNPFVNGNVVFTGDNYFCLCLVVPADPAAPPVTVGGSVTPPDTTAVPKPKENSEWPTIAVDSTRSSLIVVSLKVFTVTEANVQPSYIRDTVNTGIAYWELHSRIRLVWDGSITSVPACDPNNTQCSIGGPFDISELAAADVPEVARRFPAPAKGVQILFIKFFLLGVVNEGAGYTPPQVTNSVGLHNLSLIRDNTDDVLVVAHELGHVFGLQHVFSIYNLMCGSS